MSADKAHAASSGTDPDAVLAALRRARQRAERLSLVAGTCLIFAENGKPVRVQPTATASTAARGPEPDWK